MPECPVCLLAFNTSDNVPMLLACEHSVCLACVKNLPLPLSCPLCRKVTSESVAYLKQNPKLFPKQDLCGECKSPASCCCAFCGFLCKRCSSKIHSFKAFSSHVIVPVNAKASVIPYCEEHDKLADLYCPSDSCIICVDCKDSGTHKGHANLMTLQEAALKKTSELQGIIDRVDAAQKLDDLVDAIAQARTDATEKFNAARNQLEAHVQVLMSHAQTTKSTIDEEEQKLNAAFDAQILELTNARATLQEVRTQALTMCEGNKVQILKAPKVEFPRIEIFNSPCLVLTKCALDLPVLSEVKVEFASKPSGRGLIEDVTRCDFGETRLDVLDTKTWRTAVVLEVKGPSWLVHFDGWASKWDEWIPRASDRFAPLGTHTKGKYTGAPPPSQKAREAAQPSLGGKQT